MPTTPFSLLERMRKPPDRETAARDWLRFVQLYTPLLYYWARRLGSQSEDAADLVQDVFTVLVKEMPQFIHDRKRSFRGWLRTIVVNKWRDQQRRRKALPLPRDEATVPGLTVSDGAIDLEEAEYRTHLVKQALEVMKANFQPTTWQACWEHVVSEKSAEEVAAQLGISAGAVYVAKSRVLSRLRQELEGLLD